ncbi:MAG: DUF4097 family beta strand repeat protein [Gemmatimonadetes bacterium]|nr:DUF4097 family beta strand repeat protein [Gemmatimonadota bacterium]NNM04381.1 DUF4097 family beta strand repeat protein [Gemmatimonadota bacterium]
MKTQRSGQARLIPFLLLVMAACDCDLTGPTIGPGPIDIDIDPQPFHASAEFSADVPMAGQASVRLVGVNGKVSFEGSDDPTMVRVTGTRRVRSESQEDADSYLAMVQVSVSELDEEILIETLQPRNDGRNYEVDYTVALPRQLKAYVKTVNGEVSLTGLMADVDVDLTNGKIAADLYLPSEGAIDLFTVNGEIDLKVQQEASAQFKATLTHGTISDANLDLQDRVSTPRSLTGRLGDGSGRIQLGLVNGDIRAEGR